MTLPVEVSISDRERLARHAEVHGDRTERAKEKEMADERERDEEWTHNERDGGVRERDEDVQQQRTYPDPRQVGGTNCYIY